jgi:hypothetical protein
VVKRSGWGVLAEVQETFSHVIPRNFIRTAGWATEIKAGAEGAAIHRIRISSPKFDNISSYRFTTWVIRGPVPVDTSNLTFSQSLFQSQPAEIWARFVGIDHLYFTATSNANTVDWPDPAVDIQFNDGFGPRVGPNEIISVMFLPSFISGGGVSPSGVWTHIAMNVLGGVNPDYAVGGEQNADGRLRSLRREYVR